MDPYGALRTAVLLVMFTQLVADASAQKTPTQHAPISTLAVCEMAMMLHENPAARLGSATAVLSLPELSELGITDAPGSVLYTLLVIDAALRAQTHTKHRALFLALFKRIVMAALPFASTTLVDDSDAIPAGLRGSVTAVINDVELAASDDACKDLKLRVGHLKTALMSFVSEPQRAQLNATSAALERGLPFLSAVME